MLGRITLVALVMQAHAAPPMAGQVYNARPVPQVDFNRRAALATAASMMVPMGNAQAAYKAAKSFGVKDAARGGSTYLRTKKIAYDPKAGRTPGADSITREEEIGTSGRFGLEERKAGPPPQFYSFRKVGRVRGRDGGVQLASETQSDESDLVVLTAAGLIGFMVGSGVTFALFRHRFVPSAAFPLLSA